MFRVLCVLLLSLLPAVACKWDRDTLKEEAKGKLDTVKAITGWFDRYPARYYEMRLERVTKELEVRPAALDLFDDAGVACSRLGRYDEAIAWMEKKKAVLDRMPAKSAEMDRYRYLANLGSFHMDRWISRAPEVRNADLKDLRAAEKFVVAAIELNPDAHFGRERYQLQMIRWLLHSGPIEDFSYRGFLEGPFLENEAQKFSTAANEDAVAGLTGLILLGEGWMSADIFKTLYASLMDSDSASIAQLAFCRAKELEEAGMSSLHPLPEVRISRVSLSSFTLSRAKQVRADQYFKRARVAAESRRTAWLAYQEARFERGMHPDSDPGFWHEWQEPDFPRLPALTLWEWAERNPGLALLAFLVTLVGGVIALYQITKWSFQRLERATRLTPA